MQLMLLTSGTQATVKRLSDESHGRRSSFVEFAINQFVAFDVEFARDVVDDDIAVTGC